MYLCICMRLYTVTTAFCTFFFLITLLQFYVILLQLLNCGSSFIERKKIEINYSVNFMSFFFFFFFWVLLLLLSSSSSSNKTHVSATLTSTVHVNIFDKQNDKLFYPDFGTMTWQYEISFAAYSSHLIYIRLLSLSTGKKKIYIYIYP